MGIFDWSGQRNLREFLLLARDIGFSVMLRIGPFCHGESRNGGLPDWLYGQLFEARSNDPRYLHYVRRYYAQIATQCHGLMFRDGGPIVGSNWRTNTRPARRRGTPPIIWTPN